MPNATMSTSDGGMLQNGFSNNILAFKNDFRYNGMNNTTDSGQQIESAPQIRYQPQVILDNVSNAGNSNLDLNLEIEEDPPSTVSSENPIIGYIVRDKPAVILNPIDKLGGLKPINSLSSFNSLKSNPPLGLKPFDGLKPGLSMNIKSQQIVLSNSLKKVEIMEKEEETITDNMSENLSHSKNVSSSSENICIADHNLNDLNVIRTISTISALPTRLLPTQGVDLTINQIGMGPPTITAVVQDSGMDTISISTNSSDIV